MKYYTKVKAPKLGLRLSLGTKGSQSAKRVAQALSEKLGYKVFRTTKVLTKTKQVSYGQGVDKIAQYKWFEANNIPALEFTTDVDTATQWVDDGQVVFGRKLLTASCGKGIVVLDGNKDGGILGAEFLNIPVFTKYKKKKREFRVHVFRDAVVRVVEKKLRSGWDGPRESKIRNLANGFVFCSCENEPEGIRELAVMAGKVVSSDFKGVDIGYNEKLGELFVIEVNSAPGIEGQNVQAYVNAILA